jgi:uncharacterized membrane protein YhaH (DUF805 family)
LSDAATSTGLVSLLGQALRGTLRFAGRSRRYELVAYLVFQLVAGGLIKQIAWFFLDQFQHDVFALVVAIVFGAPMVALTVRRLHDLDAKAIWALPIVGLATYNLAMSIVGLVRGAEARIAAERVLWPLDWLGILVVLGALTVVVAPGTHGPNRYGPDPRDLA